ncbi:hypothetical protein H0H87_004621 [Tephrocybe sp. NHM501043]|nr:hypothetical protein H0H87_004621 [Tephrocybe sp. NHM501043]
MADAARAAMRPLDPVLIGSFPAPPTHIPVTPTSPSCNPPLSRPPSTPLPPLPGVRRGDESLAAIDVRALLESDDDDGDDDDLLAALPPLSRARAHTLSVADPIDPQRSASPDIATILSTTPRPLLRRHPSSAYRRSHVSLASALADMDAELAASDDDDTRSWIDHDEYGKPLPPPPRDRFAALEPTSDSEASDSSLDLHTPLPHLMLRHGLLSPNSKLITNASAPAATSAKRHPKDTRDTLKRRVRHRDGKLLKGGIGLTTGLGWSDRSAPPCSPWSTAHPPHSEDEDAPSALTRRISALNLSRPSTAMSLSFSRSTSSLSRSTSSLSHSTSAPSLSLSLPSRSARTTPSLLRASDYSIEALSVYSTTALNDSGPASGARTPTFPGRRRHASGSLGGGIPEHDEYQFSSSSGENIDTFHPDINLSELGVLPPKGANLKREKSLPPLPGGLSKSLGPSHTSTSSSASASAIATPSTRTRSISTSSRTSHASRTSAGSSASSRASLSLIVPAPSSSSSAVRATITKMTPAKGGSYTTNNYNSAKSSPDLGGSTTTAMRTPRPLRLVSQPSAGGGLGNPSLSTSASATPSQQTQHLPAPLLLAQRQHLRARQQRPVPVPQVSSSTPLAPPPLSPLPLTPTSPSPSTAEKPKPRTGTGMVYRSSSGPNLHLSLLSAGAPAGSSRMRVPSSVRPPLGQQRPIPL